MRSTRRRGRSRPGSRRCAGCVRRRAPGGVAQQVRVVLLLPHEDQVRRRHEVGHVRAAGRRARKRVGADAEPAVAATCVIVEPELLLLRLRNVLLAEDDRTPLHANRVPQPPRASEPFGLHHHRRSAAKGDESAGMPAEPACPLQSTSRTKNPPRTKQGSRTLVRERGPTGENREVFTRGKGREVFPHGLKEWPRPGQACGSRPSRPTVRAG